MELRDLVGLAGVPVIMALVAMLKQWVLDERWWPVLALVLGLAINVAAALVLGSDIPTGVMYGVVAGLAAAGLYDVRRSAERPRKPTPQSPHA